MKVAYLASASNIHTVRWVNALALQGVEIYLLSMHPPREWLHPHVRLLIAPFAPPFGYVRNRMWVRETLDQIAPDLFHVHYASGYGTLAALVGFKPTILSVWGSDVYEFPAKSWCHWQLIRWNLSKADVLLSTSVCMARHTERFTEKPITVTPFGVDVQQFRSQAVESIFDRSEIVIGTVKALEEKYGIEYLIRAFKILRTKHERLKLLIVGGGSEEANLRKLTADLGLTADVVFTGWVRHEDTVKYLNMLTVYVALSVEDSESFGVAVVEASACERAVVVSNVCGLLEVVDPNVTGLIVAARDPKATAEALDTLICDHTLRTKMGQAGRERVKRLFDWQASVTQMCEIYRKVAERPLGKQKCTY